MKKLVLVLIVCAIASYAVQAFSVIANEPVISANAPFYGVINLAYPAGPMGDARDIFLPQTLSGQLHPSSQYYAALNITNSTNSTNSTVGPLNEICDTASGQLIQAFNTFQYPIIPNPFPQAPGAAGFISVTPGDVGIGVPSGFNLVCQQHHAWSATTVSPQLPAYYAPIPVGKQVVAPGMIGAPIVGAGYTGMTITPSGTGFPPLNPINLLQIIELPVGNVVMSTTCGVSGNTSNSTVPYCFGTPTTLQSNKVYMILGCTVQNKCDTYPIRT